ncbi:MAG: hypothetical protein GEV10_03735 [Streptosporangiales bacterium]|nr:hypothetical protein [Streptosporangiales bacterium]
MATVTMLDQLHQAITAAQEATSHAGKAAGEYERARGDFRDSVFLPITGKEIWDGTGQPEASTVVRVHERAQETAALRLRQFEAALDTFEMGLRYAQRRYGEFLRRLPNDATVHDDGWVTTSFTGAGPNPDVEWAAELREILGLLDAADATLVSRLGELTVDPLPVLTTAATPGIFDAAGVPYLAANADVVPPKWDDEWTIEGNTRPGSLAEWTAALGGGLACAYTGGGFIKGPDGRWYPIATPNMTVDGETYGHGDGANDVGGTDEGWQTIDVHMGFGAFGEGVGLGTKFAVGLGKLAGGPSPQFTVNADATAAIATDSQGRPILTDPNADPSMTKPPGGDYGEEQRQTPGERQRMEQAEAGGGAVDMVTNGLEGARDIQDLDDANKYTYRTEFQQNTDGRTRVVVTAYQVMDGPNGPQIQSYDVHVDANGETVLEEAEWYDDPAADTGPIARGGDGSTGAHPK